ncbi:MAG: 7-cyano-7-deazaguanine reductase [Enterobacterales bacterium]|jgi:7-cyano-7-deazaguanine reductase
MSELLLGKSVAYESSYNADLLMPVPRAQTRKENGIEQPIAFKGIDIWNAWELSWLNQKGKPLVASARFQYSADSLNIIESKSFKLYLNSLNQTKFSSKEELLNVLAKDLGKVAGSAVEVTIYGCNDNWPGLDRDHGICLDDIDINVSTYHLSPDLLKDSTSNSQAVISEQLVSHLFKSNCMVTGQPDWASIFIDYRGRPIAHQQLLQYLISFREHQAFHEPCVERIFTDLMSYCKPESLAVYCRYTRRGGLDINPYRSTADDIPSNLRIWRQ